VPFDPFDRDNLLEHFNRHGADFGASTPEEYEALADEFMNGERSQATRECVRQQPVLRMICRYSTATEEYGVKREGAYLVTYFIPQPLEDHQFATNLDYYRHKCK
jgi:pyocin large subunit-like protein